MNYILFEGIYLLKTREFVNSNQEIYKIGRSNNLSQRILNYPNKSVLHLMIECYDSILHEKNLIKLFTSKYKQEREYGKEYFSGVLNEMKDDIINYLNPIMNNKQYKMIKDTIIIDRQTFIDDKTLFRHQMDLAQCIVHNPAGTIDEIKIEKLTECVCVCGKNFTNLYNLERHLKGKTNKCKFQSQHKTIETYNCKYCNKLFSRKYSKERHEKIYCSKKDNNTKITSNILSNPLEVNPGKANPGERIIYNKDKACIQKLAFSLAKITNRNIFEIILEHHIEDFFLDDLLSGLK